jgi:hypothetical protein
MFACYAATEIVDEVCSALPEVTESVTDMPGRMTKSRNDLAHHLLQKKEKESLEIRFLRWLVVVTATLWLLRGLRLLRARIAPDVLHLGYMSSNRVDNVRANLGQFVRELGRELQSRRRRIPQRQTDRPPYASHGRFCYRAFAA